jgi:two-component system, cell cycle sensor histidine kinase and response regulator CckA
MNPTLPANEDERLQALRQYKILDSKPEERFDDLTLLASHICKTPIAMISLIDENRQWFKSKIGITATETPRDISFCGHAILQTDLFEVENAQMDERFRANPLVTGDPHIQFYAGAPLITADGHALGTLCVVDRVPRQLSAEQKTALRALSRQVVAQFELKRSLEELQETVVQLKRMEGTLQLLGSAVEQATESILITDANLDLPGPKIVFVNPAFTSMTGYTADEAIGRTPRILQGPRTDKAVLDRLRKNLDQDEVFAGETINYRKDGTAFDLEWKIAPVRDSSGKVAHFLAIQRDVSERKAIEGARDRLAAILENTPDLVSFADTEGHVLYLNRAGRILLGVGLDEDITKTVISDFIPHPESNPVLIDGLPTAAREGTWKGETILLGRDGHEFPVSHVILAHKAPDGKLEFYSTIMRDITERKKTEAEIRLNEQRYRSLVEATTSIVWDTPASGEFQSEQPGWSAFTGQSFEELLGWGWLNAVHPDDRAETVRVWKEALANRSIYQVEHRLKARDNTYHDMMVRAVPILSGDGTVFQWIGLHHDITRRKRLETQLHQSQKLETVGKLAGGIAHEFNSILTAIMGQSELLIGDLAPESPLVKNATEINKAAVRASTLTRQLLAYGRKQILQPEILDLSRVLADMGGTLQHLMGPDVKIRISPAVGVRTVRVDAGQIEQVIVNMAMNARDAMPNGGQLILEMLNVTFDKDTVGFYPELKPGDYVMLAIADTGMGMSTDIQARLFEPFFSTKDIGQGTGLGLSTCYGIIKQSGGHISVYSELGRGTTFKIYLPQVDQPAKALVVPSSPEALPHGTETILLVEDDPALREMAADLLGRLGYKILTAANGIEAMGLRQRKNIGHIDLLFTDVVMPHMSGKELSERIRVLSPHTRILFSSAYTENAIVHQGILDAGVSLLQKPFTPSALAKKVRDSLDQLPAVSL